MIKGGAYLESGRLLKVVALDKTGTLTQGKPVLTDSDIFSDLSIEKATLIAASLDEQSTHPVAKALVNGWKSQQPGAVALPVSDFSVLNGRGVKGTIDGHLWHLGNHRLVEELGVCSSELEARLSR
ncbi:HAD family hydrolase, partial [Streptomyces sp. IBSBF 2807]|nr:HAD family hydrolase [Streptomyces hilarionis]